MRNLVGSGCGALLVLLCACAPMTQRIAVNSAQVEQEARKQREIAVEDMYSDQMRLYKLTYPLITRGHGLCAEKTDYITGAIILNKMFFGKDFAEATASVLAVQEELKVMLVVPGSPAERAGLRAGDLVHSIGGTALLAKGEDWPELSAKLNELMQKGQASSFAITRAGVPLQLTVQPEAACAFRTHLSSQDAVNAFADGKRVVITRGMMRFARDDNELSLVIAHELAHNAMGHLDAQRGNFMLGSILDVVAAAYGVNTRGAFGSAAAAVYSQDFEAEADYVGLYMLALAGLELEKSPTFWRRMASAHPGSIKGGMLATHPTTPERFVALEEAVREIRAKQLRGEALHPEMKKPAPVASEATP